VWKRSNPVLHRVGHPGFARQTLKPALRRLSAISGREENRAEQRGDSPASFDRRSNSSPRHPGYSDGDDQLAFRFELLASHEAGGFSRPHLSSFRRSALLGRNNACLRHTGSFCGGIRGLSHEQCSTHLSYSGSLQNAALVGLEPTTIGSEVTQAFTTPQTSFVQTPFLLPPGVGTSAPTRVPATQNGLLPCGKFRPSKTFLRAHAWCVPIKGDSIHQLANRKPSSREEPTLTDSWGVEPQPYGWSRSNRELRHPRILLPRHKLL
jgi:hypothetical protein